MAEFQITYAPVRLLNAPAPELRAAVRKLEDAGVDGVCIGDHVSFFIGAGYDALVGANVVSAMSDQLITVLGVYLLPLRHPAIVARQLADLSALAPGRLVFGVGIGGEDPHEVQICGVDPKTRGRRMDECLAVLRGLLTGEPVDFDGEFFQLEQALILPKPSQPVPIVVGGRSNAALSRAARLGDGWYGLWVSAKRYGAALEEMRAEAAAAGRTDVAWHNCMNVWCGIGATPEEARSYVAPAMQVFYQAPYENFEKWSPHGTPAEIAEFLAPYVDAGCDTINLQACGASLDAEIEGVAEIRERLLVSRTRVS